ncbi:MAG: hypothetical protein ACI9FR_003190 [Cryomorphaceae bacterium]|jgi:hypothetical protein
MISKKSCNSVSKKSFFTFYAFVIPLIMFAPIAWSAAVVELSAEDFAQYGQEDAYWTVNVTCEGSSAENIIQRKTDGSQWCAKEDANACDEAKDTVAKRVCSDQYLSNLDNSKNLEDTRKSEERAAQTRRANERQLAARKTAAPVVRVITSVAAAPAVDKNLLNKISIEEQRLSIEQERLKLRRRELELERRAVEIEEQLESMG